MRSVRYPSSVLFLGLQGVLYLLFLSGDLTGVGTWTVPVKYASILLCLLFSLGWSLNGGDKLVSTALVFTLGADTFLLLLNRWYILGVSLFCVVQGLYLLRIVQRNGAEACGWSGWGCFSCPWCF